LLPHFLIQFLVFLTFFSRILSQQATPDHRFICPSNIPLRMACNSFSSFNLRVLLLLHYNKGLGYGRMEAEQALAANNGNVNAAAAQLLG